MRAMNIGPVNINRRTGFSLLGSAFFLWATWPFLKGFGGSGGFEGMTTSAGFGLLAAAKLIAAGICFAVAFADLFSLPFTKFIDSVFGMGADDRKPPLDLSQAERYMGQGMTDAAEREFRRLLEYYPSSLKVWKRFLTFTAEGMSPEKYEALLDEATHEFRRDRERQAKLLEFVKDLRPKQLGEAGDVP